MKWNSVINEAGSNSASHAQQPGSGSGSTPLRSPSSEASQGEDRIEPKRCPSHRTHQSPGYRTDEAAAATTSITNVSLLKTPPTKGDSARLAAEHVNLSSLHPSASWSAYPG